MSQTEKARIRLDSWKSIASYLQRDVTTVIRWEKEKCLPVHRVPGGSRQAVFAYAEEIDAWLAGSSNNRSSREGSVTAHTPVVSGTESRSRSLRRRIARVFLASVLAVVSAEAVYLSARSSVPRISAFAQLTDDGLQKTGLVTDGNTAYFGEHVGGRTVLSAMSVYGGPIRRIDTPFATVMPQDISSDGSKLLLLAREGIEAEGALWTWPLHDGSPQRVGDVWCHSAAWSPDSGVIAYANGNAIYVTSDLDLNVQELKSFAGVPRHLVWSPDGSKVRFAVEDPASLKLSPWEMTLDNSLHILDLSPLQLLPSDCCGAWDWIQGDQFVSTGHDGNSLWLTTKKAWPWKSARPIEIGTKPGLISGISSNNRGTRSVILATRRERAELYRKDRTSGELVPFLAGLSATYLDFSRDGKWVAYTKLPEFTLWVSRSDGSDARQLTFSPLEVSLPRWSPDGTQIAFTAKQLGKPWRVFLISPQSGEARLLNSGTDNQGAPTWSPDGKQVLFGHLLCEERQTCAVHRTEIASGKEEILPGSQGLRTARWSPDGRYVAALDPARQYLMLSDLRTHTWRRLAENITGDDVNWSSDSRYVYTVRSHAERPEVIRVRVEGGVPEVVVNLSSFSKLSGRIDTWFCLAPDGALIVLRWLNAPEIYAVDWTRE